MSFDVNFLVLSLSIHRMKTLLLGAEDLMLVKGHKSFVYFPSEEPYSRMI